MKQKVLLTLFFGGCMSVAAWGQTEKGDITLNKTVDLNPIVVTGTGTHERLKNTPTPVSVITSSEIKKAGITDFQQAMTMMVPSLSFSSNAMGSYLMMNGLSNKYVLILINGRKLIGDTSNNIDLSRIDMSRVKRIEVLNGAGSSLYGSDAIAGVINIITNDPKDVIDLTSSSRYSGKGQYSQNVNLDIAKGAFGSYTSFKHEQSDGWQNNSLQYDTNKKGEITGTSETVYPLSIGFHSNIVNQKFTFAPTDKLSFYANGGYYWKLTDRPTKIKNADKTDNGGSEYDLQYESYNFGAGALYKLAKRSSLQFDFTGDHYDQRYKYLTESNNYKPGDYLLTKAQKMYDAEMKGIFGFTENSTTVFGLDYRSESLNSTNGNMDKTAYTASAYAQHELRLFDHFKGIFGVRYDYHETSKGRFSPKAALMYSIGDFNVRATYSGGYRAPGLDELYYNFFKSAMGGKPVVTLGDDNLKPEHSKYVSLNMEYRTNKFSASATGYLNYITDMITKVNVNIADLDDPEGFRKWAMTNFGIDQTTANKLVNYGQYINFDKAMVKGFEVNMAANPLSGFTLSGNYNFAYARGRNSGVWQNIERSVRHTATFVGNYAHSWKDYTLNVNLNGRIQSKRFYPGDTTYGDAPGFGIWNLNTTHSFSGFRHFTFEPGIGLDNIFNRKDMRPKGVNYSLVSPGRMVYVSLAMKFK